MKKRRKKPRESTNAKKPRDEILISFHSQFAENQNHHQRLFIQFVAAVFVVLIGYALVYTNTDQNALLFRVRRGPKGEIISYAFVHLLGAYAAAQIILCLMVALVANMGYNFRRDQKVNFNIRNHYLSARFFKKIFTEAFDPSGKSPIGFLPGFNFIFVVALIAIQVMLFVSLFSMGGAIEHTTDSDPTVLFALPLVVSVLIYSWYWIKYDQRIS